MSSLPVLRTRLSVCFLSSFSASLPQLFHRCFPSFPLSLVRFSSGLSACFPVSFVPFCLLLTTQPSVLSFPFFPFSPVGGSFGAASLPFGFLALPLFVRPVSMPSFRFRYSAFCKSFLRSLSRLTVATSVPRPSSFRFRPLPLCFRFRFWLLGLGIYPFRYSLSAPFLLFPQPTCLY